MSAWARGCRSAGVAQWPDSGCILKVEPLAFADTRGTYGCEREEWTVTPAVLARATGRKDTVVIF